MPDRARIGSVPLLVFPGAPDVHHQHFFWISAASSFPGDDVDGRPDATDLHPRPSEGRGGHEPDAIGLDAHHVFAFPAGVLVERRERFHPVAGCSPVLRHHDRGSNAEHRDGAGAQQFLASIGPDRVRWRECRRAQPAASTATLEGEALAPDVVHAGVGSRRGRREAEREPVPGWVPRGERQSAADDDGRPPDDQRRDGDYDLRRREPHHGVGVESQPALRGVGECGDGEWID